MAESEGSEVSVASAYCVVYKLDKQEWVVTGEGWAQVRLSCSNAKRPLSLATHAR